MINLCLLGCPLPSYIKEQGGGRPALMGRAPSRIPTRNPIPSRFPTREERGKEGEGEREERGGAAPSVSNSDSEGGGAALGPLLSLPQGPCWPIISPGVPTIPRHSDKYPVTPGTHPVSEYSHPIYQSSCLNHFETPRHVRDHILDSEQPSVHQNI